MGARGRKSVADLAVVPVAPRLRRPPPPDGLTDEQAKLWRDVVDAMPAGWFGRETHEVLVNYCRHTVRHRFLSRQLDACPNDALASGDGLEHWNRLAAAAERESRAALACARSLRLTQQSQMRPETAGRLRERVPTTRPPWEI